MTIMSSVLRAVSDRPKQLLGVGFSGLGAGHFALWIREFRASPTVLAPGDLAAVLAPVASYVQHHPAYVLAVLVGLALAAHGEG